MTNSLAPISNSAQSNRPTVLIIDDEPMNLEIMQDSLEQEGYHTICALDGEDGLRKVQQYRNIDAIAVDVMMPKMDGFEFTRRVKAAENSRCIPIIMQTSFSTSDYIQKGIDAGVYFYLVKPYKQTIFLSLVKAAIDEKRRHDSLHVKVQKNTELLDLMQEATFQFRTLVDANSIAFTLAFLLPNPTQVVIGLYELLINAIEHGNLGINYETKRKLLIEGRWQEEVLRRLNLPEQQGRHATLHYRVDETGYRMTITDNGHGFNWKNYINLSASRLINPNGRGIFMAKESGFDEMHYNDTGNVVTLFINKPKQ